MNYSFQNQCPEFPTRKVVKTVIVDSSKRDTSLYTSPSNFVYPITLLPNVTNARLRNYAIYNSSYVVNSSNNSFGITVAAVNYTITLTPGNYTSATLAVELAARLTASGAAVYTVTDNQATYKYTIAATVSTTYRFATAPFAAKLLGFSASDITGTSNTSDRAYSIVITPIYYLQISELQTNVDAPYPLYTMIINDTGAGNLLSYTGSYYQTVAELGAPKNIASLSIRVLDYNFQQVDFNGINWTAQFEFDYQG